MKIYRVIDDGTLVLTTVNELKALRKLKRVFEKHDDYIAWVDEEEVE